MTTPPLSVGPPYFAAQRHGQAQPVFDWARMMREPSAAAWTIPEAFFAVAFLAAACDAEIKPVEQEALIAIAHRSRALKALGERELIALNAAVVHRIQQEGAGALEQACAALPAEARAPAFAHALDIMLSDGDLTQPEAAMLNALVAHLGLAEQDVQRIADVLILKNTL